MTKLNAIYKCKICGNMVEVIHTGAGELVCCGTPMEMQEEKNEENEGMEKHIPVVSKTEKGYLVKVGSVLHPMEENHYIEWIEIIFGGKMYRKFLVAGQEPMAEFFLDAEKEDIVARAYCNVHGLWVN